MPTLESARDALVSYALSCVGLSAHPSNAPAAFGRAVAPYGPPAWVQSLCAPTPPNAANSTCEVFAVATDQAVAEQFGISGLARPLAGAVEQWAWFVGLAKKLGAHRTVSKDGPPTVGAIVHVESASSRHWYRVVEARPGTIQAAWNFVTVDGGQNDRGYQAVAKCSRGIRGSFEVTANGSLGRTVIDWIDSPALLVALAAGGSATATSSPRTSSSTLPVLRRGASGDLVRRWQTTIGVVPADGSFGPATEVATKDWQAAHSLNPDGVVGARSWAVALAELPAGSSGPAPAPVTPADPGATWEALDTLPQVPGLLEREAKEPGFCRALLEVLAKAGANVDRVTALMAEESRYNPAAHNPAGGASGLLQWMPFLWTNVKVGPAFRAVAATPEALRKLTATQQLPLVAYTLQLWGANGAQDPALAGWGDGVGSPDDTILATKDEPGRVAFYRDNAGYDRNKDGHITAGEVRAAVYGLLVKAATLPRIGPDGRPR